MRLSLLEYGALLSYSPRGNSANMQFSRDVMLALKKDGFIVDNSDDATILMSQWIAKTIKRNRAALPFASFFQPNTILVPVPKSSLMRPDTLWVPMRIASALAGMGLGKEAGTTGA